MPETWRPYTKATRCQRGGRVLGCRRPLVGQCQYCARGFCAKHGEQFGETEEVCHRALCRAKKTDLAEHLIFLAEARSRNVDGLCGDPACDSAHVTYCQRCGPRYCVVHLQETLVTVLHQGERGTDALRLCVHCISRVEVWAAE